MKKLFFSAISLCLFAFSVSVYALEFETMDFDGFKSFIDNDFDDFKEASEKDFENFQRIAQEEIDTFQSKVGVFWPDKLISSNVLWVEYSKDLTARTVVNFERESIEISVINGSVDIEKSIVQLLHKNKAEAFAADTISQQIELRSKAEIPSLAIAPVRNEGILLPILTDKKNPSNADVSVIAKNLTANAKISEQRNASGQNVVTISVPFGSEMKKQEQQVLPSKARPFADYVRVQSAKRNIEQSLIFAVIESESAFNPMAKSHIPAYGLMQIVPTSAGLDATQIVLGKPTVLAPSYLYDSEKNIEIGVVYLNILYYRYLKNIENPLSRLYCTIAAYNTGAGNVAKAFTGTTNINTASVRINSMNPDAVYQTLVNKLPYDETRQYLQRVTKRMEKY